MFLQTSKSYDELTGGWNTLLWRVDRHLKRARATLVPWTTEKLVWAAVADSLDHTFCTCSEQNTACALLFTLFSAQFLVHFLSNGGDRGLQVRVITAAAVRVWCLLVCLLVTSWPPLCDESTAWRVDRVTELTCDELTVWRVDWQQPAIPSTQPPTVN